MNTHSTAIKTEVDFSREVETALYQCQLSGKYYVVLYDDGVEQCRSNLFEHYDDAEAHLELAYVWGN